MVRQYDRSMLSADLLAGITVGIVALPLAMAFAIASGVGPERGIFTAIVAGFVISLLGGSRVQIGGPTGAFIIIVVGIVQQFGYDGLVVATLMAGVFLVALGISRMGSLIKFVPFPVTTGFTTGIAVVIFSTQIRDLLGLRMEAIPSEFLAKWGAYWEAIGTVNWQAAVLSGLTVGVIVLVRRCCPKWPNMLIGMLTATVAAWALGFDVETIGSRFGELPRTLPSPAWPAMDFQMLQSLLPAAFTIAMLAAIESLLSATVADGMIGGRHRSNMEQVAQGVANIASVIFGGIPATGATARTATNVKSGARSPVAGMVHAMVLALVLLFFAPYAKMIPLAALAGILAVVSYNMSELDHFLGILKAPRGDVAVLLITFLLTVLVDLTVAVEIGLALAAVMFIRRMAEVANVGVITRELQDGSENGTDVNAIEKRDVPSDVDVYEVYGPFFFGAADKFKEVTQAMAHRNIIILRMRYVTVIDATGLYLLREFLHRCRRHGITLILSGVHAQPIFAMQRDGLWDEIGQENVFGNIDDALNRAREILGLPQQPRPVPFVPSVAREQELAMPTSGRVEGPQADR